MLKINYNKQGKKGVATIAITTPAGGKESTNG